MSLPTETDLALGDEGEDHPRRLVLIGTHLVAYGGELGTVSIVSSSHAGQIDAKVARHFDEPVRAIAVSHDLQRIAIGFDNGSTQIFSFEPSSLPSTSTNDLHPFLASEKYDDGDGDNFFSQSDGLAAPIEGQDCFPGPRFDVPVRHMQFDPRSYLLAIASESGVCIVDVTSSKSLETRHLQEAAEKEHDSCGIRGVSYYYSSSKTLLATLAMDGRLCVWDVTAPTNDPLLEYELLQRDSHKCVPQKDVGEIHGADSWDRSCLPVFGNSHYLALPGMTDVQLRRVDEDDKLDQQLFLPSFNTQGHADTIVAVAFSPDENHLVTSGRDGRVVLWELAEGSDSTGQFVAVLGQYESIPTHMIWRTEHQVETLYVACANGKLVTLQGRDNIVPTDQKSVSDNAKQTDVENDRNQAKSATSHAHKRIGKISAGDSDDDATVDFNEIDEAPTEDSTKKTTFVLDEADEDNESAKATPTPTTGADVDTVDDNAIDLGSKGDEQEDAFDNEFGTGEEHVESGRSVSYMTMPEPQPPFAPSSTPLDLPRRIMCWNHIGTISLLRGNDGATRNTVDIDFTNAATRRPVSFTDNMGFILGSLGEDGAVFATDLAVDDDLDADEEDGLGAMVDDLNMSDRTKALVRRSHRKRMNKSGAGRATGSSIYFHRFETFGALRDKDWYLTLPDGERAVGCASGEGWAAVITSRRFVRFFTSGGNQGPVMWLKGEPVTVVGRSSFLAVIFHESSPLPDGTQKLGFALFDALPARLISSGSVSCIGSGSSIQWAGFNNDCSLLVMDQDGMLSMLVGMAATNEDVTATYSWEWSPVLDTVGLRKSADDKFFPITCQDGKLVCVPLKGGNDYPDAARRPVTTTLSLRMPLASGTLEKTAALEELSVRANIALSQKKFLNEAISYDPAEKDELESEYHGLCAQVDKVTLKLFISILEAGKLERALDLVERLHLEKSFDIAITVADRLNHRNLSDRIDAVRERRFAVKEEETDDIAAVHSMPFSTNDYEDAASESTRISPDLNRPKVSLKQKVEDDFDDDHERKATQSYGGRCAPVSAAESKSLVKQSNPFAKKRLESPAKPSMSPAKRSPPKPALSRSSTFSTQSRKKSKISKLIL